MAEERRAPRGVEKVEKVEKVPVLGRVFDEVGMFGERVLHRNPLAVKVGFV